MCQTAEGSTSEFPTASNLNPSSGSLTNQSLTELIYNLNKHDVDRLRPAYEQVKESVRESAVIYVGETGFPVSGDQHWVWTLVTEEEVLYTVDQRRRSPVIGNFLDESPHTRRYLVSRHHCLRQPDLDLGYLQGYQWNTL